MLRILLKKIYKVFTFFVEGRGVRTVFKKLWNKFWKAIDIVLGIIPRIILKYSVKVDDNKIFFHTQENVYTCNPKYITEELLRRSEDVSVVWRGDSYKSSGVPFGIKVVKYNSYDYFKEIYSAKIVVTNSSLFLGMPVFLKKDQVLFETWHGSLGLKKWSKSDIKDSFKRVFALEQTGRMTDYCISNSELENGSMRSTYWPKTEILKYGHARNDIFFDRYKEKREEVKKAFFEKYQLEEETKLALYAPTFRDSIDSFSVYNIDYEKVSKTLENKFGGDWKIIVKFHPSLRTEIKRKNIVFTQSVINATGFKDMQELISIIDLGITDYSSWIYDYILTRKPGFIYAEDIEEYSKHDRGFYYPITETPFSISTNSEELCSNIIKFDGDLYRRKVEEFLEDKGCVDDGHASERIVDKFLEILDD